ncbi:MAG: BON domain-containing protein [Thermoanaerobaculia bacterium]
MKSKRTWIAALVALALGIGPAALRADDLKDAGLTMKVKLVLLEKLGAEALEVDVDTTNAVVRLSGDVEKRETIELAPTLAKSVEGVASVDNDLTLEADASPAKTKIERAAGEAEREVKDAILESRIRIALIDAIGASGFKVGTEAADGTVVLEMPVDFSKSDRSQAIAAVRALDGVKKVSTVTKS